MLPVGGPSSDVISGAPDEDLERAIMKAEHVTVETETIGPWCLGRDGQQQPGNMSPNTIYTNLSPSLVISIVHFYA